MEFLTQLWLPIVVSGVVVFLLSALAWTVMPHHKKDFTGLPNADAVQAVMSHWPRTRASRRRSQARTGYSPGPRRNRPHSSGPQMPQSLPGR